MSINIFISYIALLPILFLSTSLAQGDEIELFLNSPLSIDKPEPTTLSKVGIPLVEQINRANKTIDFALYGLRNQDEIYNALIAAKKRGVVIRGIVDKDVENNNYYSSTPKLLNTFPKIITDYQTDILTAKKKFNQKNNYKPYCVRPKGFKGPVQCIGYSLQNNKCIITAHASREPLEFKGDIMHNKFFIFDGSIVWTGSTNASDSGTGGYNANNAVIVNNKMVANWYTQEFEQMYKQGKFHRSKTRLKASPLRTTLDSETNIEVAFSPQYYTMERLVRPLIKNARRYIDLPVFFLTHKKIAGDLIAAHQRGVKVRIIIDATAAKNGYTKHEILRAAGIDVKVENWGGKMHMKTAVIDGEHLIIGSMNWTSAGERSNDENTLIIHSQKHASKMHIFFNMLWDSIPSKWLKANPDPESINSGSACFDGVDNDFDNLADEEDPGCGSNPPPLPSLPSYRIVPKQDGYDLVKGNITKAGNKIYQVPGTKYYNKTKINTGYGEKWFCSVYDAQENGWVSYSQWKRANR